MKNRVLRAKRTDMKAVQGDVLVFDAVGQQDLYVHNGTLWRLFESNIQPPNLYATWVEEYPLDTTYLIENVYVYQQENRQGWIPTNLVLSNSHSSDGVVYTVQHIPPDENGDVSFDIGDLSVDSTTVVGLALANITKGQPVIALAGGYMPADVTNITHAGKVCGVAKTSSLAGESVTVVTEGYLLNDGWNFTAHTLWLGLNSSVSENYVSPGAVFQQSLGTSPAYNVLVVNIGDTTLF